MSQNLNTAAAAARLKILNFCQISEGVLKDRKEDKNC